MARSTLANSSHSVAMISASAPSTASSAGVGKLGARDRFHFARFLHAFRIVGGDVRAFAQHVGYEIDRDRGANVVGVRFEGQAPDRDLLVPQDPERIADRLRGSDPFASR